MPINSFSVCNNFHHICNNSHWGNTIYFWKNYVAWDILCWNRRIDLRVSMGKFTLIFLFRYLKNLTKFVNFDSLITIIKIFDTLVIDKHHNFPNLKTLNEFGDILKKSFKKFAQKFFLLMATFTEAV